MEASNMMFRRATLLTVLGFAAAASGLAGWTLGQTRQEEPVGQGETVRQNRGIDPAETFLVQGFEPNTDGKWESVLVQVPVGKWLVLTDMSIGRTTFAQLLSLEGKTRRVLLDTSTYRDHFGPWADPKTEFANYHSATGIALPPGSKLIIRNGGAGSNSDIAWHLTGFYEDQ
jgi:hypothetical protein